MKPVHHEVKAALLRRIRDLPLESQLPSDRDLAREFNVAFLTINRVMNDLEREGYVERRPRRGTFLASHERPVALADAPRGGGNGTVVFAYPNWFSFHYWRHVRLAEEFALKSGMQLLEYKLTPESTPERVLAFAQRQPDLRGIIMLPVSSSLTPTSLRLLDALGLPVVLLFAATAIDGYRHLYACDTDWLRAGWVCADAFLRAGHRRLAWINNEPGRNDLVARGMRQALKEHGLRGSDLTTYTQNTAAWTDSRIAGYELTQRLLASGDATAALVDSLAGVQGALRALWERGLRAPQHLSLIAEGMQSGDEEFMTPPLTTFNGAWSEEMRWVFAVLGGEGVGGERARLIPVELRERGSVAAPRAAGASG
jgi:DNA-binding LacI/PurR family transcriptional regulator